MLSTSIIGRHQLIAVLMLVLFVFGSVAIAGTKIQLGADDVISANPNNPHQIPANLDPKSEMLSEEIRLIKYEVREEILEVADSVHDVAMRDFRDQSKPTLDYTTGTSN
jgi:ActR/RegA family two-component response regulator